MPKILIVDDDLMNGKQIKLRLEKRNYECEYVSSGEDCLKAIEEKEYDCVLLDIMMPGISGLDVLKQVRETKNSYELPIIMVTAKDEADDIVAALKLNANDYITKPVNIDIATARINTQVDLKNLIKTTIQAKRAQTVTTMITTLNHEINNPLAIAIGNLTILGAKEPSERIDKAMNALNRITDIVKKVDELIKGESLEETAYSDTINMFDLQKEDKKND